ncbi:hypothetical protein GW17_00000515 [Ensete ventricosum]|nr:hypothetical protein GW17_00000515 [Ensete ventricosum]
MQIIRKQGFPYRSVSPISGGMYRSVRLSVRTGLSGYRYVPVCSVIGTRTVRYRVVPPKSTVGGRLREKSTVKDSSCMVPKTKGASRHMHLISEKHLIEELRRLNLRRRNWGQKVLARGNRTRRGVEASGQKGRENDNESRGTQLPKNQASVRMEADSKECYSIAEADLSIKKKGHRCEAMENSIMGMVAPWFGQLEQWVNLHQMLLETGGDDRWPRDWKWRSWSDHEKNTTCLQDPDCRTWCADTQACRCRGIM